MIKNPIIVKILLFEIKLINCMIINVNFRKNFFFFFRHSNLYKNKFYEIYSLKQYNYRIYYKNFINFIISI
jgi:hypothetical protein